MERHSMVVWLSLLIRQAPSIQDKLIYSVCVSLLTVHYLRQEQSRRIMAMLSDYGSDKWEETGSVVLRPGICQRRTKASSGRQSQEWKLYSSPDVSKKHDIIVVICCLWLLQASHLLFRSELRALGGEAWYRCLIKGWAFRSLLLSVFWPVVDLC